MGDDDRLAKFGERLARLETRHEQIPSNAELISTAGAAGKLAAREHLDGLSESFQKDTHQRLEALEHWIYRLRMYVVFTSAAMFAIGIIIGQKLPIFIP